jgi:hypothetical protein
VRSFLIPDVVCERGSCQAWGCESICIRGVPQDRSGGRSAGRSRFIAPLSEVTPANLNRVL